MAPDVRAAIPNPIAKGRRSWLGNVKPNVFINGWAAGSLNIRAGAVKTARKGRTAPMLRISANEAANMKIRRRAA